jgi:hypothetical protein
MPCPHTRLNNIFYGKFQLHSIISCCSFETIIVLVYMTCIVDAYELHPGDEKVFKGFMMNIRVLQFTSHRGLIVIQKHIFIIMLMTRICDCNFIFVYILSLVFLSLQLYMYCFILQKKKRKNLVYRGFLEYIANALSFCLFFFNKDAPLGKIPDDLKCSR